MSLPIHVQAKAMGLVPPVGCTAKTVRELGYQVPDYVLDPEIYTQCGDQVFVLSYFTPAITGYVWVFPPGRFEYMQRGPMGNPTYIFIPDLGVRAVYRSDPTPDELSRASVVPNFWVGVDDLIRQDYELVYEGIHGARNFGALVRKFLAIRPHFG